MAAVKGWISGCFGVDCRRTIPSVAPSPTVGGLC